MCIARSCNETLTTQPLICSDLWGVHGWDQCVRALNTHVMRLLPQTSGCVKTGAVELGDCDQCVRALNIHVMRLSFTTQLLMC